MGNILSDEDEEIINDDGDVVDNGGDDDDKYAEEDENSKTSISQSVDNENDLNLYTAGAALPGKDDTADHAESDAKDVFVEENKSIAMDNHSQESVDPSTINIGNINAELEHQEPGLEMLDSGEEEKNQDIGDNINESAKESAAAVVEKEDNKILIGNENEIEGNSNGSSTIPVDHGQPKVVPKENTVAVETEALNNKKESESIQKNNKVFERQFITTDLSSLAGQVTGYRILQVHDQSPASGKELVPWFDFIVEANGYAMDLDDGSLVALISDHENQEINFLVYNTKNATLRMVKITPKRKWDSGIEGQGMLGLTIKFDTFENSDEDVIHVLQVTNDSPAYNAGLESFNDYILGAPFMVFQDLDDLNEIVVRVADNKDEFEVFVYNIIRDDVRRTLIKPSSKWGSTNNDHGASDDEHGLLGCDVGHGYLHQIPEQCKMTLGFDATGNKKINGNGIENQNRSENRPISTNTPNAESSSLPSEQINSNNNVRTKMGDGVIIEENSDDGSAKIQLDWGLANGAVAIAHLSRNSFERLMPVDSDINDDSLDVSIENGRSHADSPRIE